MMFRVFILMLCVTTLSACQHWWPSNQKEAEEKVQAEEEQSFAVQEHQAPIQDLEPPSKTIAFKSSKSLKIDTTPLVPKETLPGAEVKANFLPVAYVNGVRLGEEHGRTRIVFDLDNPTEYTITPAVQTPYAMTIFLNSTDIAQDDFKIGNVSDKSLIESYYLERMSKGTQINIILRKPVNVIHHEALIPNGRYGHRVFVDLKAQ